MLKFQNLFTICITTCLSARAPLSFRLRQKLSQGSNLEFQKNPRSKVLINCQVITTSVLSAPTTHTDIKLHRNRNKNKNKVPIFFSCFMDYCFLLLSLASHHFTDIVQTFLYPTKTLQPDIFHCRSTRSLWSFGT